MPLTAAHRRITEHRTVTGAAALAILLAAVTFSLLAATASAIANAGTRAALAAAPVGTTSLYFTALTSDAEPAADKPIAATARRLLAPYPVQVVHADLSAALTAIGPQGSAPLRIAVLDGVAAHVHLLSGSTPTAASPGVLLPKDVAERIGVTAGGKVALAAPAAADPAPHDFPVTGVYQSADADATVWGAVSPGTDVVAARPLPVAFGGPGMLAPPPARTATAAAPQSPGPATNIAEAARAVWNAQPDLSAATPQGAAAAADRFAATARGKVDRAVFHAARPPVDGLALSSHLPQRVEQARRAETAGLSSFLIVGALLGVLAAFALALTLRLVREHLADESFLLRARGGGTRQMLVLAGLEGTLLALPALVATPFLTGPLSDALRRLSVFADLPRAAHPAAVGAKISILITIFCVTGQCLAAVRDARGHHRIRGVRAARAAAFQHAGVDVALGAVALLGYLQLRHYDSPVTAGFGDLAVDPVLVLAPAVTAAALAALVLRFLPLAAALADRRVTASRGFGSALGLWQVSRRAARHAGTVLLLVLALAVGALTVTDTAMRSRSAADRAAFQTGADARLDGALLPPELLRSAYSGLPGVTAATPLHTGEVSLGGVDAQVVAVDPRAANGVLALRSDLAGSGLGNLLRYVTRHAPPADTLAPLAGRPTTLTMKVAAGQFPAGATLTVRLVDADGTRIRRTVPLPPSGGPAADVSVALIPPGAEGLALSYPLRFSGFEVRYAVPRTRTSMTLDISSLRAGGAPADPGEQVPLPADTAWLGSVIDHGPLTRDSRYDLCSRDEPGPYDLADGLQPHLCGVRRTAPDALHIDIASGQDDIKGPGTFVLGVDADSAAESVPTVPVVVTDHLAASASLKIDQSFAGAVNGRQVTFHPVGRVAALPGLAPDADGLLADWSAVSGAAPDLDTAWTTDWLLALRPGSGPVLSAAFRQHPEYGTARLRTEVADRLRTGAFEGGVSALLLVSACASPVFAAIGFAVSAVIVLRTRRHEFGVLRALGARPRQLSRTLWTEQCLLALVAVAAGVLIGVATAAWTVPLVTVDDTGAPVFPSVTVAVPWFHSALIATATALAVVAVVMAAARTLARVDLARTLRAGEEQP